MRCRSTKEAGELVTRILGGHDPHLDHAAIAMVRSMWWTRAPKCPPNEPRGVVIFQNSRGAETLRGNQAAGEILWR